jgi:signal transduction histidine kinase
VASHDLHEPLRKILTFSERLKGKFQTSLGDDGKVYLDRIWASADSMRNLIDNLLDFSRITRSARTFVPCNLNSVLRGVMSDQELRIEETTTILNIGDLPEIEAVPAEMKQLFNNLIGNALKFRKKDVQPEININCRKLTHKEKSDLFLPFNQVFFKIDVVDNGIGFESVYSERIFEIFQRLHGKTEYAGSGIGLSICKKIVENHDGIIYATSEPGKGSIFSVILPEKQH